jgi:hypothetical protein
MYPTKDTTQNTEKMSKMDPTKDRGLTQVLVSNTES